MMSADKRTARELAAILVGVALVLAPNLTALMPDRDSGVFLYVGDRILDGEIPYRDVWDHKGPLIYFINSLAAWMSPRGEVGIWALEYLSLCVSTIGLFFLMVREFGRKAATLGTAMFLAGLVYTLRPGNFTEEFALPLIVGSLALFRSISAEHRPVWKLLLLGVAVAACGLLRPNNLGTPLSIGALLLFRPGARAAGRIREFGYWLGGLLVPAIGTAAYFAFNQALDDLVSAVFNYNMVYLVRTPKAMLDAVLEGFALLAPSGLAIFALSAWGWRAIDQVSSQKRTRISELISLAMLALPVELALVALSGRSLNHYYILWLPASALLAAWFLQAAVPELRRSDDPGTGRSSPAMAITLALLVAITLQPARRVLPSALRIVRQGPRDTAWIAGDIGFYDEAYLLMWGAETSYNYLSGRPSPSRYAYQYPLYTCGYVSESTTDEFRRAITGRNPLIIDTSQDNARVPPLEPTRRAAWLEQYDGCAFNEPMQDLLLYIDSHYSQVGALSRTGWPIYQRMDGN